MSAHDTDLVQIHCDAILFDMDGVLIDSTPAVDRVWRKWALEHGFPPDEVVARAHGRPSIATLREYLPGADHEAENRIVELAEMDDLEDVVPLPGAQALLRSLPPDRWIVVTSSTRPLAEVRLRAAGLTIPISLVTSSDVTHGKPHPEPYLKGARLLGFPAFQCVVIEDAPAGIRAGKLAGARVIGFRTTTDEANLRAAGADWVLNGCVDVSVAAINTELTLVLRSGQ